MIIIAWSGVSVFNVFQQTNVYRMSSIFITAAFLRVIQSTHIQRTSKYWLKFLLNQSHFSLSLGLYLCCLFTQDSFEISVGVLDIILNFPSYIRWKFTGILRTLLKLVVSLAWVVILPSCYLLQSKSFSFAKIKDGFSFLDDVKGVPPLYIAAVAIYLLPNLLNAALFVFPMLRRFIENSDWHIIRMFLWWSQVYSSSSSSSSFFTLSVTHTFKPTDI